MLESQATTVHCDIFARYAEEDLADMVRRDRNHISIFAWSIGNEIDYRTTPYSHPALDGGGAGGFTQPVFGGYKPEAPDANRLGDIAKRLVSVVKRYDRSRPSRPDWPAWPCRTARNIRRRWISPATTTRRAAMIRTMRPIPNG